MRMKYFKRKEDGALVAKIWFGPHAEGPPGYAHGGTMAAVMDEGMGAAAWLAGYPIVVAKLNLNFRNKLPLGTVATLETKIERVEGKKIFVTGQLSAPSGMLFCEGEALLVLIPEDKIVRKTTAR